MILKILIVLIAIASLVGSFYYKEKDHQHFASNISGQSDSIVGAILCVIIGFLLAIAPWWVVKFLLFVVGILLMYMGLFLI